MRSYRTWLATKQESTLEPARTWHFELPKDSRLARDMLSDAAVSAALNLPAGHYSAIIPRGEEYYLVEVVERMEQVRKPFTEVLGQVKAELGRYPALRLYYYAHRELVREGSLATSDHHLVIAKWARKMGRHRDRDFQVVDQMVRSIVLARAACTSSGDPETQRGCRQAPPVPQPAIDAVLATTRPSLAPAFALLLPAEVAASTRDGKWTLTAGAIRKARDLYLAVQSDMPLPNLVRILDAPAQEPEAFLKYWVGIELLASQAIEAGLERAPDHAKSLRVIGDRLLAHYVATATPEAEVPPPDEPMARRFYDDYWDRYVDSPTRITAVWIRSRDRKVIERFANEYVQRVE